MPKEKPITIKPALPNFRREPAKPLMQLLMEEQASKNNNLSHSQGVSYEQMDKQIKRQNHEKRLSQRVDYFCGLAKQYLTTNEGEEQAQ